MATKKSKNPLTAMTAGCIAGAVEATCVWPMEFIKVRRSSNTYMPKHRVMWKFCFVCDRECVTLVCCMYRATLAQPSTLHQQQSTMVPVSVMVPVLSLPQQQQPVVAVMVLVIALVVMVPVPVPVGLPVPVPTVPYRRRCCLKGKDSRNIFYGTGTSAGTTREPIYL